MWLSKISSCNEFRRLVRALASLDLVRQIRKFLTSLGRQSSD